MRKNKTSQKQPGFIRIISGQHRGRKLPVHDIEGLRPTTDRVKETLFNWLMNTVRDSRVLDCFAGAGSLGFEAQSRFAKHCLFLELDKQAAQQLSKNAQLLKSSNCKINNVDALAYLASNTDGQQFDVVFVDPPFRKQLLEPCCQQLESQAWLDDNAYIYVEYEQELSPTLPSTWQLIKEKKAGQVISALYQKR
ncbi:16S rRNA (guanine(966)-N(2))-methyltransferase RsmD [Pseudoalteromonas sp. T1lg65]|uniref:16S rRNA (guanine(966)-N(2))-methyltransferase RsmD n=1 Tax=Pseudoalteromonas sp. T1lg65 TaxID=2077101 RepID=UPI003F795330